MSRRSPKGTSESDLKELWPGQSIALLKELHILTREGALNQDSRRKLKQVLHLVQLLRGPIEARLAEVPSPRLADLGAGKAYLGLILYDLIFAPAGRGEVIAVEARADLAERVRTIAAGAGFDRIVAVEGEIGTATVAGGADIVTALHACDTATDDAIHFALRHEARVVALVPCCQAEIARLLPPSEGALHELYRHPLHARTFAAHLTNVLRGLYLEAHGYKVRVTEFTGFEHTQKNELILAERHQRANPAARARLERLLEAFKIRPRLIEGPAP